MECSVCIRHCYRDWKGNNSGSPTIALSRGLLSDCIEEGKPRLRTGSGFPSQHTTELELEFSPSGLRACGFTTMQCHPCNGEDKAMKDVKFGLRYLGRVRLYVL